MKRVLFSIFLVMFSCFVHAQGIVGVTPSSASLNTTGVNITIVLDSTISPPGPVQPSSVNIGPALGYNVTRINQYVYATFNFTHMISGTFNVAVIFPGPPPDYPTVYFTISAAFTVTDTTTALWKIPGTAVLSCFDNQGEIPCPTDPSDPFYGQNSGIPLSYTNNGDGTVTDLVTGLMWQRDPGAKKTFIEALTGASSLALGGYNDWRVPTIKELYSLIQFNGVDPNVPPGTPLSLLTPFIDTGYFVFHYGDTTAGERIIDSQYWSCTEYVSVTMGMDHSVFGVNFADGRIKSYPRQAMNSDNKLYTQYVRGNPGYGLNHFQDNGDNTVNDSRSGLMWSKSDCQTAMNWESALAWAQMMNVANYCGYDDWRLPTTKELESLIDYSRSPVTTNSAAIDPVFNCTPITDEAGYPNWPWYWTTTTHESFNGFMTSAESGVYVCFGSAFGWMKFPQNSYYSLSDVHGAGAQRSSPKAGTYLGDSLGVDSLGYTVYGKGPQGDVLRVNNFARLVRNMTGPTGLNKMPGTNTHSVVYPNPFSEEAVIRLYCTRHVRNVELSLFDNFGRKVRSMTGIHSDEIRISGKGLLPGIYFYLVTENESSIDSGKLVIR